MEQYTNQTENMAKGKLNVIKYELTQMDLHLTAFVDKKEVLESIEEIRFQLNQIVYLINN